MTHMPIWGDDEPRTPRWGLFAAAALVTPVVGWLLLIGFYWAVWPL